MSIRARYKVQVAVSSTDAEERDLGNGSWEVVTDVLGKGGSWKTLIPAGTVNLQIPLDSIASVKLLVLRGTVAQPNDAPSALLVRLNSDVAIPMPMVPLGDVNESHFLLTWGTATLLTSLYVSNPGTTDMQLTLTVAGD